MRMQHGILAAVIALAALPSLAEEIPADDEKRVTVSEKVGEGALVVSYARRDASDWIGDPATLSVDEDIMINGVLLKTGTYGMYPEAVNENDWHFVFSGLDSRGNHGELLRVAIRPKVGSSPRTRLALDNVKDKGRSRRADLVLSWGGKVATLRMKLTGQRRGKGLNPKISAEAKEAWAIVKASVDALVAEDFELHARDFAEDFETELSDGGGTLAHLQTLWQMQRGGGMSGMDLNFERLEIDFGEDELSFRNLIAYSSFGPLNLNYRLLKRNEKWQVRNFRIGDRGGEEDEK